MDSVGDTVHCSILPGGRAPHYLYGLHLVSVGLDVRDDRSISIQPSGENVSHTSLSDILSKVIHARESHSLYAMSNRQERRIN